MVCATHVSLTETVRKTLRAPPLAALSLAPPSPASEPQQAPPPPIEKRDAAEEREQEAVTDTDPPSQNFTCAACGDEEAAQGCERRRSRALWLIEQN